MIKKFAFSALLRVFMILSVLVLAAFTTSAAWAASPTAGDVSGKKPPTVPQTGPSLQDCLANGVHSALYQRCLAMGLIQSSQSQSKLTNSTSNLKTPTLSTNKNSSGSSSNTNNQNQPLIKLGKVPSFNTKGSDQPTNTNTSTNLTIKNGSNSSPASKDPSKSTTAKASDPPAGSLSSNQNSVVQSFEKLTGHKLSSAQVQQLLSVKNSSNTGNGSQFIHQLENVTGNKISNQQVAALEKQGLDPAPAKNDPPSSSLTNRIESITGHTLSTSQLDKLIAESVSGTLNAEGETQLLQTIENITGTEITASEAQRVERALGGSVDQTIGNNNNGEGSESVSIKQQIENITGVTLTTAEFDKLLSESVSSSHNSEGETKLLQELENLTGGEISAAQAQEVEDTLGGTVSESIHHVTSSGEETESTNSENETSLLQQIEDITGHEISNSQLNELIDVSGSSSLNSEGETQLLQDLEGITGTEISASEAQEVEDAIGGGVSQGIESGESTVIESTIPITGLVVTNVFGEVSSLTDANGVSNFVIGNTTVQLNDSLKGSNNFANGDFVSVNGGFSSTNVFVGNALVNWVKPPFVVIAGNVSSFGIVNSVNETAVPGVVSFMIGNTTIRMSSSIEGTDNIKNGDYIKLDGFYVDAQNQVVNTNTLNFITAAIDTWTPVQ